ncbi:hypothetical protein SLH49_00805 [Cognatiyoonia sp. IB215446]|uniref:hypothetical protein n=1 Tax=Cognatiyoonia sp. IB215446 TaxID=3097355 RepID=UPI002A0F856E|nr:hypothetical protein [Cognatiyoonia sp. IB215446]MDX8346508.1 hypothetical protein [Cognatiyoonia sp. IB215446]
MIDQVLDGMNGSLAKGIITQTVCKLPDLGAVNLPDVTDRDDRVLLLILCHLGFQRVLFGFQCDQLIGDTLCVGAIHDVFDDPLNLTGHFGKSSLLQAQFGCGCFTEPVHFLLKLSGEVVQILRV